jgi:hypothetical protein
MNVSFVGKPCRLVITKQTKTVNLDLECGRTDVVIRARCVLGSSQRRKYIM